LKPEFKPLERYEAAAEKDFVLLIGDRAIEFQRAPHTHEIFDLGAGLAGVDEAAVCLCVWALRRGVENKELRYELRAREKVGMETLDYLIETREEFRTRISGATISSGTSTTPRGGREAGIAKFWPVD